MDSSERKRCGQPRWKARYTRCASLPGADVGKNSARSFTLKLRNEILNESLRSCSDSIKRNSDRRCSNSDCSI